MVNDDKLQVQVLQQGISKLNRQISRLMKQKHFTEDLCKRAEYMLAASNSEGAYMLLVSITSAFMSD
jgi:hypothetical protein